MPDASEKTEKLETEFREFFCGYESLAFWLEGYEENPLDGLDLHTPFAKKLKRQIDYIHANRTTTTLEETNVQTDDRGLHGKRFDAGEENHRVTLGGVLRTYPCTYH